LLVAGLAALLRRVEVRFFRDVVFFLDAMFLSFPVCRWAGMPVRRCYLIRYYDSSDISQLTTDAGSFED
jgi:hypothetical protein